MILLHLDELTRAEALRNALITVLGGLPAPLRPSLTWDQGTEMCHQHQVAEATGVPVFFCQAGMPWQRPSNENANGLLRDNFPKSTDLRVHTVEDLQRVADEVNHRPRKTLDWRTPAALFANLREQAV